MNDIFVLSWRWCVVSNMHDQPLATVWPCPPQQTVLPRHLSGVTTALDENISPVIGMFRQYYPTTDRQNETIILVEMCIMNICIPLRIALFPVSFPAVLKHLLGR